MKIDDILRLAFKMGVSDVHFTVNSAPAFRLHGHLRPFDAPEWKGGLEIDASYIKILAPEDTDNLARQIF
ncbi:MAG: type IV pili twitching motility protein PilT, partial [Bacillota bacterium]|nr:type IV pili twitching motility protein PilT [Bacillota bacterium]